SLALLACAQIHATAAATDPVLLPADTSPALTDLPQVQVQGERYDPRRDDTASRLVVAKYELVRYGDSTLADVMKRLPGVTVTTGAPGSAGAITLRGMGNGYTQILLDG